MDPFHSSGSRTVGAPGAGPVVVSLLAPPMPGALSAKTARPLRDQLSHAAEVTPDTAVHLLLGSGHVFLLPSQSHLLILLAVFPVRRMPMDLSSQPPGKGTQAPWYKDVGAKMAPANGEMGTHHPLVSLLNVNFF